MHLFNCEREKGLTQLTVRVPASQLGEVSAGVCGRGSNLFPNPRDFPFPLMMPQIQIVSDDKPSSKLVDMVSEVHTFPQAVPIVTRC